VVVNLLSNAARYTAPGGRIDIEGASENGHALLRVRDTGRGIDADKLESIFDMFVQGRPVLERVGGGLGIGLALARRIAELHGGTLAASSAGPNLGAEFTLRLPLAHGAPAAPRREIAPSRTTAARRVLVVDDNVDAATTLHLLLRSLGHETRVAYGGREALDIAAEFQPDIVLLDIGMPEIDGYEVARRLRTANAGRELRIVAITGWGQQADRDKSREAGFDVHLVKPVEIGLLSKVLGERNGATLH
jgi:CheY-like chemotaxis protein